MSKKFITVPRSFTALFLRVLPWLLVGFPSVKTGAASVPVCNLENMLPFIESGLREYAAETLYEKKIKTYPKDVQVTYSGQRPVYSANELTAEGEFDVKAVTEDRTQIVVFTSWPKGSARLRIPQPVIENHFDQNQNFIGKKCVVYLSSGARRVNNFKNEKSGTTVFRDVITGPPPLLAWVAIQK